MPRKRGPSRAVYAELGLQKARRVRPAKWVLLAAALAALGFVLYAAAYLRSLSSGTALSDARDRVTLAVEETVSQVMRDGGYGQADFVTLEKDGTGSITAITTNTVNVNLLSSEVLRRIVAAADNGQLDIRIPLGDLLGSNLLLGRGPAVPVRVGMMTSPYVHFENNLTAAGINQSRHTLTLVADVDIDILIPWGTLSTTVETEVLIAETVVVGRVPGTYITMEEPNGSR